MQGCETPVQALVVLQGADDTEKRCRRCVATLWTLGPIPVLVSGNTQRVLILNTMTPTRMAGVIERAYSTEVDIDVCANNTAEHTHAARSWLEGRDIRHVGLVTSETHAKRALLTFEKLLGRRWCWHMITSEPHGDPEEEERKIVEYGLLG